MDTKDKYKDMIDLPHYEPQNHKRMSSISRAAQFAPFAALTGYDEEVKETARRTDSKIILDDGLKYKINDTLNYIKNNIKIVNDVEIVYFLKDKYKNGGKYLKIITNIKKIDEVYKQIILSDNKKILIDDILDVKILKKEID